MKKRIILYILIIDLILFGISSLMINNNKNKYTSSNIIADATNELVNNNNYQYVQITNIKEANNKQDILNIIYTMLNNGYDYYDFKCSKNYNSCVGDLLEILNNRTVLNVINNLVNTYNSIDINLKISYLANGNIRLFVNKKYNDEEKYLIDTKIDTIINSIITDNMTEKEKVKTIHDYLANSITYGYEDKFDTAYGALFNGVAVCSGYADAFSLFMDKLNIPNYKVVSDTHVWNVIYINNTWKHIDVTFDDPINIYGTNATTYDYFLISTNKLNNFNSKDHNFNKNIYTELV